jgi:sulfur transfer complex TusBCD TusB component (DsrH family)
LRQMYHRLRNCFGCNGWCSWVTRLKWMLVLIRLERVLVLVQDGCTVCAKYTIVSEIVLDTPDGTPR